MEGRELRRLRQAHGLTTGQLAAMVNVSPDDIEQWECQPAAEQINPISPAMRQLILRKLALWRDEQEERSLARPRVFPAGFTPGHLVPSSVTAK